MGVQSRLRLVVLATSFTLSACSGSGSSPSKPTQGGPQGPQAPLKAYVAHTNDALGTPSFAWLANAKAAPNASPIDVGWSTLRAVAPTLKLSNPAVAAAKVSSVHDVGRGAIITRFGQNIEGVDVFGVGLNVTM